MAAKRKKVKAIAVGDKYAASIKRLVNKVMGVNKPPDPKAGQELLRLIEQAERKGTKRLFAALAKPGANDIIFWAAEEGHAAFVKRLIDAGVNPEHQSMGIHPLYFAAKKGRTDVIEILVEAGASPTATGLLGNPVLNVAADEGQLEAVKTLVRLGADVNARDETGGKTALITIAPKATAEIIRELADKGADVNAADDEGLTPLTGAAAAGNLEAVRELIRLRASVNYASRLRSIEEMEKEGRGGMFAGKALRKMRLARKDPLITPLMVAAGNGHAEIVEELLKAGAKADARAVNGQTATDFAKADGHATVLRVLSGGSAAGAPEIGIRDLLQAVESGDVEQARAKLRAGLDVNASTTVRYEGDIKEGFTPIGGKHALLVAAERGDLAMVNALLEAGADPNLRAQSTLFDNGRNALHAAAERGDLPMVQTLLRSGAKPKEKETGRPNIPGLTPMQLASAAGHRQVVEELLKADRGKGRTKAKGPKGLHEAVKSGDEKMVALLVQQGADVDALSTGDRWSPLMYASFEAFPNIVQQLLDAGANVNGTNRLGQTALTVALHGAWLRSDWDENKKRFRETLKTIEILIKRGADVNVDTWDNKTPLDMALEDNLEEIAAILRKAGAKT
jgi:ankyrin repeat protein